jgi:serine/threonine-protein kinase
MARDPVDRYQKIEDLKADLVRFMRGGSEFPPAHYAAGDHVVREGEPGDAAYIIQSGSCEVYRERGRRRISLKIMGPGEVFGETAILTSSPRTATVVALEDTVVRVVTREILETEVGQLKPWMGVLVRTLAERFRDSQRRGPDGESD